MTHKSHLATKLATSPRSLVEDFAHCALNWHEWLAQRRLTKRIWFYVSLKELDFYQIYCFLNQ